MPAKLLLTEPGGVTVASRVQAEPFHFSAITPPAEGPVRSSPTATHLDELVQARPVSFSRFGVAGGGSVRQVVPFHASKTGAPRGS